VNCAEMLLKYQQSIFWYWTTFGVDSDFKQSLLYEPVNWGTIPEIEKLNSADLNGKLKFFFFFFIWVKQSVQIMYNKLKC